MNDRSGMPHITLSIAAVERDTGLSKDTLRVWERRYGFPSPLRDLTGERAYTLDQVEKLRVVKRLMDAGHRPGRVVPLSFEALQQLTDSTVDQPVHNAGVALATREVLAHIDLIRSHDVAGLRSQLSRQLARVGIGRFVTEVVAPLNTAVGDAWIRGQMEIFEEHSYSETMQVVLRQAIASLPHPATTSGPTVLLTTFPGEPHGLGLLMAEAMFALEGGQCFSLGTQTPLWDIVMAASAFRADIVALGFTGCMSPNLVVEGLQELRDKLPPPVQVWAGGGAPVLHRRRVDGVKPLASLDQITGEVRQWRAATA
jgi:MerR family transcriptional regulator, light-induced transcriptional regulator